MTIAKDSGRDYTIAQEAVGNSLMYLIFAQSIKPNTVTKPEFLDKYFKEWRAGMGNKYIDEMRKGDRFRPYPIRGKNDTLSIVVDNIRTYIKWLNANINTRPSGSPNQTITYTGYLDHSGKVPFTRNAIAVLDAVDKHNELVGI